MQKATDHPVQLPLSFDACQFEDSSLIPRPEVLELGSNVVSVEFRRDGRQHVPVQGAELYESMVLESLLARAKLLDW